MSQFTTPLVVELIGENLWRVYESFEYHVGSYPSNEIITVPKGFVTNFASAPRICWCIVSPVDGHGKAAVLHDYLYEIKYKNNRKYCDKIFLEALEVLKVNIIKRYLMFYAVRLVGWIYWKE